MNSRVSRRVKLYPEKGNGKHSDFNFHKEYGNYQETPDRMTPSAHTLLVNRAKAFLKHAGSKTVKQLHLAVA
jgi:hypothetical protein